MPDPLKGYRALRRGRHSTPHAEYFVTICARRPTVALSDHAVTEACFNELRSLEQKTAASVRCAIIMPDHLHLLLTIGQSTTSSDVVRMFKGRLTPLLRKYRASWQPSFYDHRLRSAEDRLSIFLYIFLNPYRRKLVPGNEPWPGFYCAPEDWAWFEPLTNERHPEPEWLS